MMIIWKKSEIKLNVSIVWISDSIELLVIVSMVVGGGDEDDKDDDIKRVEINNHGDDDDDSVRVRDEDSSRR